MLDVRGRLCGLLLAVLPAALGCSGLLGLDELNASGVDDDDPPFTDNLLEVYINSNRGGEATRNATSDPWDTPVRDDQLSSVEVDGVVEQAGRPAVSAAVGATPWGAEAAIRFIEAPPRAALQLRYL
jgi:hypothetical protein